MRIRRLSILAASTLIAPVLIVLPPGVDTASAGQDPVPTTQSSTRLLAPSAPTVAHGSVATNRDLALARSQAVEAGVSSAAVAVAAPKVLEVSPAQPVPSTIAVIGVTWSNNVGKSTVVQYRSFADGAWSDWQAIEAQGSTASGDEGTRSGSDPITVSGASLVQTRVMGPSGGAPADAKLTVIDPGTGEGDDGVGAPQPGAADAAAARPTIHSRRSWGADESLRRGKPDYMTIKGVIVHHTAGTNNYSPDQVPAILRGIYAFHVKDRGWNDIAYNFLVDKWGRVWEGRYGGTDRPVQGAHALGWNTQTMGVSVLGDYMKTDVSDAAVTSVEKVIAWKSSLAGINPNAMTTIYGKRVPTVQGHRDVGSTTCPGTYLYSKMDRIRRESRAMMTGGVSNSGGNQSAGNGASSGSTGTSGTPAVSAGAADVLMRSSSGALFRSMPVGTTGLTYATKVSSSSWAGYDAVLSAGDLDRNGTADVLARVKATGRLVLFTGAADGTLSGARNVGVGWGAMSNLTVPGDLTGDRIPDLVATDAAGTAYVYPGSGRGTFSSRRVLGRGFTGLSALAGVGDWNGDGKADLIAVRKGVATLYRGNGKGGVLGTTRLVGSWGYPRLVGLSGARSVLAVDAKGTGYMIAAAGGAAVRVTRVAPNFRGLTVFAG